MPLAPSLPHSRSRRPRRPRRSRPTTPSTPRARPAIAQARPASPPRPSPSPASRPSRRRSRAPRATGTSRCSRPIRAASSRLRRTPSGDEIAEGFSAGAGDLLVQACRRTGDDSTAELSVETHELTEEAPRAQIVRVSTPDEAMKGELASLGLDLIESGGPGYIDVLLANPAQAALVNDEGFEFEVLEDDLAEASVQQRAEEAAMAAPGAGRFGLPSGNAGPERRHVPPPLRLLARSFSSSPTTTRSSSSTRRSRRTPTPTARSSRSRSARTSRGRTGARHSSSRAPTTDASGRRPSTRWSSATSSSTATTTARRRSRSF